MKRTNAPSVRGKSGALGNRGIALLGGALLLGTASVVTGVAQAQSAPAPSSASSDDTLTWKGITVYGIVDIGLQYLNHGAPISDYFPPGTNDLVQKADYKSITAATPSNLSQSRVGMSGNEPLGFGDWSGIFRVETYFNPQSGQISDGLRSVAYNNGRPLNQQYSGVDTSVDGQLFQQSYAGISSRTYGTLTFGRQNTVLADGIAKYDPLNASNAFSVIGFSGVAAGGGNTEDRRLDQSLKYMLQYDGLHAGAQYKFSGSNGGAQTAWELQFGGEYGGLSVDAYYVGVRSAIGIAPLTLAQTQALPTLGYSPSNSLLGIISDTTTFSLMGSYDFGKTKIFAAYEHIRYADPSQPLPAGQIDEGGYVLAFVNNSLYANAKDLQIYWTGVKYTVGSKLDLYGAFYGYTQNSFATGAQAGCSTNISGLCSGNLRAYTAVADYRLSKRFDLYGGAMWSGVYGGLDNGFIHNYAIDPTIGVRFKF